MRRGAGTVDYDYGGIGYNMKKRRKYQLTNFNKIFKIGFFTKYLTWTYAAFVAFYCP